MQGWIWDFEPNPIDNSSESGKIVFDQEAVVGA